MEALNGHKFCEEGKLLVLLRLVILFACIIFMISHSQSAQAQSNSFDWSDLGIGSLQSVDSGTTLSDGPRTVTITHQEISDGGTFGPGFDDSILLSFAGQIGDQPGPLVYSMQNDSFDPDDRFESIFSFNGPLENLSFTVSHVDRAGSPRHDGVTIEYDTGTGVFQNIRGLAGAVTLGPVVGLTTLSGVDGYHGIGSAGALASTTGDIDVDFGSTLVERVRITYHFGQDETGSPQGGTQFVGLSDFDFDIPIPANFSDLSLVKTVNDTAPTNGSPIAYTLTVSNSAASTDNATGVTVRDILPVGVNFVSASGDGTYNEITGIWDIGIVAIGSSQTITINVITDATSGATVINSAEIITSSQPDIDSGVNNGVASEDDQDSANFTIAGTRTAGVQPTLICTTGFSSFEWNNQTLAPGSLTATFSADNVGDANMVITTDTPFVAGSPAINNTNTGGAPAGETSLFLNMNNVNRDDVSTAIFTLPTAIPGIQFTLYDVDFGAGSFADRFTVTGEFNGATVIPTLTNGVNNFVSGNTVIGDVASASTSSDGNAVVTFLSPVDTIIIEYGNGPAAPINPGNQFANVSNFSYCNPETNLSVTKISSVISDPISSSNPKAIPEAVIRYCITITNLGSGTAANISANDNLPANVTYIAGSAFSGTSCSTATTAEDDNATDDGGDEDDPFGVSVVGTSVTGVANTLGPNASFAIVFSATVN